MTSGFLLLTKSSKCRRTCTFISAVDRLVGIVVFPTVQDYAVRQVGAKFLKGSSVGYGQVFFLCSQRERDGNIHSALITVQRADSSTMRTHNGIDKSQTQTVAIRTASLHPALEHMTPDLRSKSGPIVFKDEQRSIIVDPELDCNRASGRQMLELVVKKVGDHAMDQAGVCFDFQRAGTAKTKLSSLLGH